MSLLADIWNGPTRRNRVRGRCWSTRTAPGVGVQHGNWTKGRGPLTTIMEQGLDPARAPTWVTTERAAAENAIGPGRVLSTGQGSDSGVVTSVVPRSSFEAIKSAGGISERRAWPGFGGGGPFSEYVLRSDDAIRLFNAGIRG